MPSSVTLPREGIAVFQLYWAPVQSLGCEFLPSLVHEVTAIENVEIVFLSLFPLDLTSKPLKHDFGVKFLEI